jgi:hypothetical protein
MKKFSRTFVVGGIGLAIGLGAVTAAGAATGGFGAWTSSGSAPPIQGTSPTHNMAFYVDTVTGAGSPGIVAPCAMTNLFTDGQTIVFRMYGQHVSTGGSALTAQTVKSATVTIPGVAAPLVMTYSAHGTTSFWSVPWTPPEASGTTAAYPVGIVNFRVTVVTKPVAATKSRPAIPSQTGYFTQIGLAPPSVLTITATTPPAA